MSHELPGYNEWCDANEADFPNAADIAWANEQDYLSDLQERADDDARINAANASTAAKLAAGNCASIDAVTALFRKGA